MSPPDGVTLGQVAARFQRSPFTLQSWVRRRGIQPTGRGPHGVHLYDLRDLWEAEAQATRNTPERQRLTPRDATCTIWSEGAAVPRTRPNPARPHIVAGFSAVRRRLMADEAQQPLTEATLQVTLPNGKQLRIQVAVMPDLDAIAHADLLPDLADAS